jgi:hypothetical protein
MRLRSVGAALRFCWLMEMNICTGPFGTLPNGSCACAGCLGAASRTLVRAAAGDASAIATITASVQTLPDRTEICR